MLTYYELDLGLNHVVRKWSEATDPRANLLVQGKFDLCCDLSTEQCSSIFTTVPGGQSATTDKFDGPSGVLVCAEDYVIYKHQGAKDHRVPIPKRSNPLCDPDRGLIITASVMHKMRVSLPRFFRSGLETEVQALCIASGGFLLSTSK